MKKNALFGFILATCGYFFASFYFAPKILIANTESEITESFSKFRQMYKKMCLTPEYNFVSKGFVVAPLFFDYYLLEGESAIAIGNAKPHVIIKFDRYKFSVDELKCVKSESAVLKIENHSLYLVNQ
jgi:hypothetical protein